MIFILGKILQIPELKIQASIFISTLYHKQKLSLIIQKNPRTKRNRKNNKIKHITFFSQVADVRKTNGVNSYLSNFLLKCSCVDGFIMLSLLGLDVTKGASAKTLKLLNYFCNHFPSLPFLVTINSLSSTNNKRCFPLVMSKRKMFIRRKS